MLDFRTTLIYIEPYNQIFYGVALREINVDTLVSTLTDGSDIMRVKSCI